MARADAIRIALETSGVDPERFSIEWVSSAEAPRFAEVVTAFTEKIRALGPNPLRQTKAAPHNAQRGFAIPAGEKSGYAGYKSA